MKPSILVVDDTLANLKLMVATLSEAGYEARPLLHSVKTLEAARAARPDLILLDVDMPVWDGYEVCRLLKSDPMLASIPVIFISAQGAPLDGGRARAVGAVDYVGKPVVLQEVLEKIAGHLEGAHS